MNEDEKKDLHATLRCRPVVRATISSAQAMKIEPQTFKKKGKNGGFFILEKFLGPAVTCREVGPGFGDCAYFIPVTF